MHYEIRFSQVVTQLILRHGHAAHNHYALISLGLDHAVIIDKKRAFRIPKVRKKIVTRTGVHGRRGYPGSKKGGQFWVRTLATSKCPENPGNPNKRWTLCQEFWIPAGDFQAWLGATAEGYAARLFDQRSLSKPTYAKYTVELAKAARLTGVVTDPEGNPVKGAKVHPLEVMASNGQSYCNGWECEPYDKSTVETDAAGRFEFTGLPTGYAMVSVTVPGYAFGDASTIHDVPGDIGLRLSHPCGIQGKVVDDSGVPLTNFGGHLMVRIGARDFKTGSAGGTAPVKADGTFEFNAFPPGEYRLTLESYPTDGGRSTQDQIATVAPGVCATVTFVLSPH